MLLSLLPPASSASRPVFAVAMVSAVTSCTFPQPPARTAVVSEPAPSPQISPSNAACRAFGELRNEEAGDTLPEHGPLRIEAAQEHYRRAAAFGFSGGLRLLENGAVRLSRTYGLADHARGTPMAEEAVFDTGSVTKQFTAAAILRLEELGRLSTSDTIGKFFPDAPEDKRAITVHQLLSHQAGLRHSMDKLNRRPPRDVAAGLMLASPLLHPVGSRYSYSNVGYAVLAAIVDKLSGSSYERFLREELWLPLGMTNTGMVLPDWSGAQIADGLEFTGPLLVRVDDEWTESGESWLSRGAAGVSSTLPDLTRWSEALRSGAILSDASRRKLFWPHVRMNTKSIIYYGYGWSVAAAQDGSCVISHNGGAGIHYDVLTILPEHAAVVATFNTQQRTPWRVKDNFVESLVPVLTGAPLTLPATTTTRASPELAGSYALPSGERLEVVAEDGRLKIPMRTTAALRLFAPWPVATGAAVEGVPNPSAVISRIMEGIDQGNYRPLIERLPPNVAPEDEVDFWRGYWPQWIRKMGPFQEAQIVGTANTPQGLRTLVRLGFQRSSTVVAILHGAGGKMVIETVARSFFPDAYLAPMGENVFTSFYPTTRRSVSVRFNADNMFISGEDQSTVARRARTTGTSQ